MEKNALKSPKACFSERTAEALTSVEEARRLKNMLGYKNCPETSIVKKIKLLVYLLHCDRMPDAIVYVDVFNYGYIMGQRAERARRKGVHHD